MNGKGSGEVRLKKTMIALSTVAVIGFSSPALLNTVHAETKAELTVKQEEIQNQRGDLKAKLSDAESQIADVLFQLNDLQEEIDRVNRALEENQGKMNKTEGDISATEEKIKGLEDEIAKLEEAIEKRYDILKERMKSYQQSGGSVNYLEVIFGSADFSDFVSRVNAVSKITESDQNLIDAQERDKQKVEENKKSLEDELEGLKEKKEELKGMQETINEQKSQKESKAKELKNEQQKLEDLKTELNLEDNELASLEAEVKENMQTITEPAKETQVANVSSSSSEQVTTQSQESKSSEPSSKSSEPSGKSDESSSKSSEPSSKSSESSSKSTKSETSSKQGDSNTDTKSSGGIQAAINAGFGHIGTPYVWGGKAPGGFDCSGFVSWAFAQAGISIPSSTSALQSVGTKVSYSEAQPGDLVFFDTYKTNGHVGIYLGGGQFIGAQNSTGLDVANMSSGYWKDHFSGHVRRVR